MSYATNPQSQVFEVQGMYFLVVDGIWFTSESPTGPWNAATQNPRSGLYNSTVFSRAQRHLCAGI